MNDLWEWALGGESESVLSVCVEYVFPENDLEGLKTESVTSGWINKRSVQSFTVHSFD